MATAFENFEEFKINVDLGSKILLSIVALFWGMIMYLCITKGSLVFCNFCIAFCAYGVSCAVQAFHSLAY